MVDTLNEIGRQVPVIFPLHPRARKNLGTSEMWPRVRTITMGTNVLIGGDLAVRVEPARAVLSELVHASRRERRDHALAAQATRHEKHAPRFAPEANQVAGVDEDPARLG